MAINPQLPKQPLSNMVDRSFIEKLSDALRMPARARGDEAPPAPKEPTPRTVTNATLDPQVAKEAHLLNKLQTYTWDMARERAAARGDAMPNMTDYLISALSDDVQQKALDTLPSGAWNARSMVNFSDLTLKNVRLDADDLDLAKLSKDPKRAGDLAALRQGLANAKQPVFVGKGAKQPVLDAQYREEHEMTDDEIGPLFAEVGNNAICFHFEGVCFHPADNINHYIKAHEAVVKNCVLEEMGPHDRLELGKGTYEGITLHRISGGEIVLADGAHVTGMKIEEGSTATLTLGKATLAGLDASGVHVVQFTAAPGAHIANAEFSGTTISMASQMQGVTLNHCRFTNAALQDVDLSGATLNHCDFTDTAMGRLNLAGVELNNVTINGNPVRSLDDLPEGVSMDAQTRVRFDRAPSSVAMAQPANPMAELIAQFQAAVIDVAEADLSSVGLPEGVKNMAAPATAKEEPGYDRSYYSRKSTNA